MGVVYLNDHGNGYTYCVPSAGSQLVDGEHFEIHFVPDGGADLDSVRAYDSHDYAVALPAVSNYEISMNFRSGWGNLYVDVYYSGSTPPTPPSPIGNLPYWLLKKAADNNGKRLKKLT